MKISVLGAGAYGIALANTFCFNDNKVVIWTKFQNEYNGLLKHRENIDTLPGVKLDEKIEISMNMQTAILDAKVVVLAVPMLAVRSISRELSRYITDEQIICIVSKGIEQNTNLFMDEVVKDEIETSKVCMLSGPSFAKELASGNEIGLVIASKDVESQMTLKIALENENISVKITNDIKGVQVAASAKNVLAIRMGIINQCNKSESTKAALLANLSNDLRIMIAILGGRSDTIFSYAGIGDFLLTCMSEKSRNFAFGKCIGEGLNIDEALEKLGTSTVEGLYTLDSLYKLLKEKEVEIGSINLLYDIVYKGEKVEKVLKRTSRR